VKTVAIESPFSGDIEFNLKYLDLCILDCVRRGETPYASHRMLTTALDEKNPREHSLGTSVGMAFNCSLDIRAFYVDLGMSSDMQQARLTYERKGLAFEDRTISSIYGDIPTVLHRILADELGDSNSIGACIRSFDKLALLEQDNGRLRQWVDDLQSGMYVNCVYCGHRYGPKDKTPTSMAEVLKKHIEACPKHPMAALKRELEELRRKGVE
jgi:DNA-directed RNA polymerase subunit RPC12/RpoP